MNVVGADSAFSLEVDQSEDAVCGRVRAWEGAGPSPRSQHRHTLPNGPSGGGL